MLTDRRRCLIAAAGCGLWMRVAAFGSAASDPTQRAADITPRASRSQLFRIARVGRRLVAVGERGIVVWSDDAGRSWVQARVPVSVTLTSVVFVDDRRGWAAGHAGVVLHSSDGGETWVSQLDGSAYGRLALEQAQRAQNQGDAQLEGQLQKARRLVDDGADKPFLALHFTDASHGLAVGAYGIAAATADGGRSWMPCADRIDNPQGMHLYALANMATTWVIAGEQGYLARSLDAGKTFTRLHSPAKGSFFTAAAVPGGQVLTAGLLGNGCLVDADRGTATALSLPAKVTILSALARHDGKIVLVESTGRLLVSGDGGASFSWLATPARGPLTALADAGDGTVVAVGATGALRLEAASSMLAGGSK